MKLSLHLCQSTFQKVYNFHFHIILHDTLPYQATPELGAGLALSSQSGACIRRSFDPVVATRSHGLLPVAVEEETAKGRAE